MVNQGECGLYSSLLIVLSIYCVCLMRCVPGTETGSFVLVRVVLSMTIIILYPAFEAELFHASYPIHNSRNVSML